MLRRTNLRSLSLAVLATALLITAACGSSSGSDATSSGSATTTGSSAAPVTVRLGYFPNLTHATAIIGVNKGFFQKDLGTNKLETKTFADGTAASEAMNAGSIDATYIGSGPAVNLFQKSKGAIKIIAGSVSGGAALVVSSKIKTIADLKGKTISDPKLGNTQDVALRYFLQQHGYKTTQTGGGDVKIAPQDNSTTLQAFEAGQIDGAWVPEPYASRLVVEGGGHVLVNESSLWPSGKFSTTILIVSTKFLNAHPEAVQDLLEGQVDTNNWINKNQAEAQTTANDGLTKLSGKSLKPAVVPLAWKNLTFTDDPIASAIQTAADHGKAVGLLDSSDITGIFDVTLLNKVLTAKSEPTVTAP